MTKHCKCELCGNKNCEFIISSKHLTYVVKNIPDYLKGKNKHINKHICTECFLKIFVKGENKN